MRSYSIGTVAIFLMIVACTRATDEVLVLVEEPASTSDDFKGGNFMLVDALDSAKRYCLDLEGYAYTTDTSAPVIVHSCKEGWFKDGTWKVDFPSAGQVYLPEYELCAAAEELAENANVVLRDCAADALHRFNFRSDGKVEVVSDAAEKFCLAVGETSRVTGNNLRRTTRIADCEKTEAQYTEWILPGKDAVYPLVANEAVEDGARPAAGMGMAMGMGPGFNLYVGACAPCHAPNGSGYQSEFSPKISGQEPWYLRRQLLNFRNDLRGAHDDERWAKQMNFHIKDFPPAQLDNFVDYIVALEDVPAEQTVNGDVVRGEQLYATTCAVCHGENGQGIEALNSPRVAGMSDWYMVIQLQKFRGDLRGNHPDDLYGAQMVPAAMALPDDTAVSDVVAYINSLPMN